MNQVLAEIREKTSCFSCKQPSTQIIKLCKSEIALYTCDACSKTFGMYNFFSTMLYDKHPPICRLYNITKINI